MTTRVINIRKETPPKENYVYIGRPSKWGNPFSHLDGTLAKFKVKSREEAVSAYREYLINNPDLMIDLDSLKGKTLGCFCKPQSCHGDILVELINES